jgi:hypothetical protein
VSAPQDKKGTYAFGHRPPTGIFLGIGAGLLALNHLFVILGWGLVAEFLGIGMWFLVMGAWLVISVRSFDAAWGWAKPSMWRELGLGLLTAAVAAGLAEALAWFGYKQHLFA